jgi:hypothetical protein
MVKKQEKKGEIEFCRGHLYVVFLIWIETQQQLMWAAVRLDGNLCQASRRMMTG